MSLLQAVSISLLEKICRVGHDLQYLARARLIFSDPVIGAIQFRKIHSLHECTQKADRIVRWDHGFKF